jgi:hypothetical protein
MRIQSLLVCAALLAGGLPAITGCDDTLEKRETTDVKKDGTVVKEKKEIRETSDGAIIKEEKKSVDVPDGR